MVEAMGLSFDDLAEGSGRPAPEWAAEGHETGEYTYFDEEYNPLYVVKRGAGKEFRQFLPDGTPGIKGVRRVLFNLPKVLEAVASGVAVDVAEGEKDCYALVFSGAVPTCNSGGAKGWKDDLADSLRGAAMVRVWRDKDGPGLEWARAVTASLTAREIPFTVVEAREGKDAWDHLAAGWTVEEAASADLSGMGPGTGGDVQEGMHKTGDVSRDGRVKVLVSSQAHAADWLRGEMGKGPLSGIFGRDGRLVRVPRIGEHGYEAPAPDAEDLGPARVDPLNANQVRAMVDVRYDVGSNKESKDASGGIRWSWESKLFPRPSADSAVTGAEMGEGAPGVHHLTGVTHTPAVRTDFTVLAEPGYDEVTGMLYLPDPRTGPVTVPDAPTAEEIKRARDLVLEPVSQFPFVSDDHMANWTGAMFTPLLRRVLPPPYPMVVITATNRGSGKGFLAGMLREVHGGLLRAELPRDGEELRKQITTVLMNSTAPVVTWDNLTGVIRSSVLEALLTTDTHSDRELGANRNVVLTNDRLWTATGNNASFGGDLDRRTLAIALDPDGPDQHLRTDFRLHPVKWVRQHRAEYLGALLTLVRGWHLAGAPVISTRSDDYGDWSAAVGGLLAWADMPGTFGGGSGSVRDEDTSEWADFLRAVHRVFGSAPFSARDLVGRLVSLDMGESVRTEELPGDLADLYARTGPNKGAFVRVLGKWFANRDGRYAEGWKSEMRYDRKNGNKYVVHPPRGDVGVASQDAPITPVTPSDVTGGEDISLSGGGTGEQVEEPEGLGEFETTKLLSSNIPYSYIHRGAHCSTSSPVPPPESHDVSRSAVGFDLETADAGKLYTGGHNGPFVRLAGVISDAQPDGVAGVTPESLTAALESASGVYGHNILGFDIQALARHHGADYMALASKAVDTLVLARLMDPPGAKGMKPWGTRGYYGLDAVAERLGVAGKTHDLKALAKLHGGYDRIPVDDPEYNAYLRGDLTASRAVYERLTEGGLSDYARREMRVAALQNLMSVNGCLVDTELLASRVQGEAQARQRAVDALASEAGLPVAPGSRKPWTSKAGKEALVTALEAAGAPYIPRTATGAPRFSKDALGDGRWMDHAGQSMPGLLSVYGHLPGVRRIVELILTASGAADKYAEIAEYVTAEGRVHPEVGDLQGSGRWAYVRPSLTNVGKRGRALEQREVITAAPGHVIMAFDFDQVDMRAVAGHSGDKAYAALFEPGRDAHSEVADAVFGRHDGDWRDKSKAIGHGWNYGRGVKAISESNGLPLEMVQAFDATMRERFPRLMEWKAEVAEAGSAGHLLDNGFGRLMRCDPLRSYTQAPALMGQGGARDIMCEGLLRLPSELWSMLLLVVHDEAVLEIPEADVEDVSRMVREAFTMEFKGIPVTVGASKPGKNWRDCYRK